MSQRLTISRFDAINNRILVRNTHKLVYKKLCKLNKDVWCEKYLSVASTKLIDPKNTYKLPFSLNKRVKTQENYPSILRTNNGFPKKKSQVLAIHDSQQYILSKTIDQDQLLDASQRAQKIIERMKKTVTRPSLKLNYKSNKFSKKSSLCLKTKEEDGIQPWMVDNQEQEDKQNKFF